MIFKEDMIIWAADVSREDIESVIINEALPKGTIIKLDRFFFETNRKDFILFCQDAGYPVFCDVKIVEVPEKAIAISQIYLKYKPFMLNIMAGSCSTGIWEDEDPEKIDTLRRFADECEKAGTKSCGATILTSKSEELCAHEFSSSPEDQVLKYADLLYRAGFTDIACSPNEASAIRKELAYDDMTINTPGVRLPNSDSGTQQRIATPFDAFVNGANRLIIGHELINGDGDIAHRVKFNYQRIMNNVFAVKNHSTLRTVETVRTA
ncbi:orotidine 5'-phosphate decarboxylase [Candidatus Saccharibacteria bacterium]|nr:orotidine 5'-phosphate decarboxylase [Candidatus Saccharibacteria bacterium]